MIISNRELELPTQCTRGLGHSTRMSDKILTDEAEATQLLGQIPVSGYRHLSTFPTRGEVAAQEGSDHQSR